jgi:multidrug efflux pump subunit AcrB
MAYNFSAASIRRPVPALVLFTVLMLLGLSSFSKLPITRFPNIDVPVISVTITQSGAAPSELETQVTKKVEDAVAGIAGMKHIFSNVTDGMSNTTIELRLEINTDRALNDVKDAIAKIRADLPRAIDEPIIERVDVAGQSILTYAASAPGKTIEQLSWFVDDVVKRELQGIRAVGRIDRIGGVDREIHILLDPARLSALGITAGDVSRQLRATNVDLAGGRGEIGAQEQTIRTLGGARSVEDLAATKILLPGGRSVRLDEVAGVVDSFVEPRSFARLDGVAPVVTFSVFRTKNASESNVAEAVAKRVADLAARHPEVSYALIDDNVRYTVGNYTSAMHTLIEGAALAVLVVFIFLRDWRATLISAIALPLSIVPTFFAMDVLGFSFNLVSLLAITLVTGILVDDAIVEIENIVRHMRMGKSAYRAAMEAADEIGLAVIAITLTIAAVFAPVSFMGGIAGQYFKQFGLVVAAAVLISLLVARLITPMMAAYLMRPRHTGEARDGWIMRLYVRFLAMTLRHRFLTLLAGLTLFAASIWSTGLLPKGFIPPIDLARVAIAVELPPGTTLEDTRVATDRLARDLKTMPEIRSVLVLGGNTPTGIGREIRKASIVVTLSHKTERARTQKAIEAEISERIAAIADLRGWFVNDRGERELAVTLVGDDAVGLSRAVAAIEGAMRRQPDFRNVAATAGIDRPEIRIAPRLDEAARFGIATETISDAVRIATIGDLGPLLAKFNAGDRLVPIRVQIDRSARAELATIENLAITGNSGIAVPLDAVADIAFAQGPASIERYDRVRRVVIGADLTGVTPLGSALERIYALPEATTLPAGIRLQNSGDAEIMGEVFGGFATAMSAGLMMVLGVLVLLFGSLLQPITIRMSLPLSIGGVILALLVTQNPVSMPVVIGILMLMGIVTKNAIMLVDFAVEAQAHGVPQRDATLDAGRKRARPIVMTTIAMVAGMVPSAFGLGDGGEFRAPMAIGVVGGLIVSTVLSLVFVPSLYTVMDDISRWLGQFFGRFIGEADEAQIARLRAVEDERTRPAPAARDAAE